MKKSIHLLIQIVLLVSISACSTLNHQKDNISNHITKDPYEKFNRKIYSLNTSLDKAILRPIAQGYNTVFPELAKQGISNFFSNLSEPWSIVNNTLQGKFERALTSTYRLTVNSTVGLIGFIDIASLVEVKPAPEDLGQTLAAWGVKPGPYIILPIIGPTNFRDGVGTITQRIAYSPSFEISKSTATRAALSAGNIVNIRSQLLGLDSILNNQVDPYSFLKYSYEQQRIRNLYDGKLPQENDDDF